jgi:hypothetical protein
MPVEAVGIVANVTITDGTAASFLTVYPSDATRPTASNLNWSAGQSAKPNQVTVGLSTTGAISVYNSAGSVDVIVDNIVATSVTTTTTTCTPHGSSPWWRPTARSFEAHMRCRSTTRAPVSTACSSTAT